MYIHWKLSNFHIFLIDCGPACVYYTYIEKNCFCCYNCLAVVHVMLASQASLPFCRYYTTTAKSCWNVAALVNMFQPIGNTESIGLGTYLCSVELICGNTLQRKNKINLSFFPLTVQPHLIRGASTVAYHDISPPELGQYHLPFTLTTHEAFLRQIR